MSVPRHRTANRTFLERTFIEQRPGKLDIEGFKVYTDVSKVTDDYHRKELREDGTFPPTPAQIDVSRPGFTNLVYTWDYHLGLMADYGGIQYPSALAPVEGWNEPDKGDEAYATSLLSVTSPFRSTVSIPVIAAEMVEIFTILRLDFSSLVTLGASANLNYSFGIAPLINDIRTLGNIIRHINTRVREFESLFRDGGLRRRTKLDSYSGVPVEVENTFVASGPGQTATGSGSVSFTTDVYGSLRWKPKSSALNKEKELTSVAHAFRQVTDLESPDFETVWQIIPFSFLIDYFINVGEVFASIEGSEFIEPHDICIMRYRKADQQLTLTSPQPEGGIAEITRQASFTRYERSVFSEQPSVLSRFHTEFPTWKQGINILSLLALIRSRMR